MEYQSSSSYQNIIVTDDDEQGNTVKIMQIINELRENINHLQCELKELKEKKAVPIDLNFQEDLKKIKTGMKVCSSAIQSTNDLFKNSDKKNAEISNELKALKREVNKRFDVEKDVGKRRIEIFDFLNEGMAKLQNRTKQLGNEIKNVRDGLTEKHEQVSEGMQKLQNRTKQLGNEIKNTRDGFKEENKQVNERIGKLQSRTEQLVNEMKNVRDGLKTTSSTTQSTRDLLKNSDKRISDTLNEVRALEKEIRNLPVRNEALNDDSIVREEDLTKLRNGVLNIFSRGIQQVSERSKHLENTVTNVRKKLQNQQEKVNTVEQSTNSLKNQYKDTNEKQAIMEKSIKQFSNGMQILQSELKAEQQKNITLENKVITFECHLNEILLKNDVKQNFNKEISSDRTPATNTSPNDSGFPPETCKLKISNPQTTDHRQMDVQSKFFSHDFEWTDSVAKGHDNVNFNEEVKSKYSCEKINQKNNSKEECRDSLTQKIEAFCEKESKVSSVNSEIDELTENQYEDLAFDSSSGKEGALLYLEKAHAYLQNLQMMGTFPVSDEESLSESDGGYSVSSDLGDDSKKDCGEGNKEKKKKRKKKDETRDTILSEKIEWIIHRDVAPVTCFLSRTSYQSCVFYTGTPGYRLQLHANIGRREREVFFCLRVLKGAYDDDLEWPYQQGISIKSSKKMQPTGTEYCFIPEKDVLKRPKSEDDKIHTKWIGPFNLSHYLGIKDLIFDIYLG